MQYMETLAGIFVSLVMAVNTLAPNANLPQVLGTEDEATSSASNTQDRFEKRSDALENARKRREAALEEAKKRRENAIERAKDARDAFKEKLAKIKDERKQKVVENIDEGIANRNQKWVEQWNNVLGRLRELVTKIETNAQKLKTDGKDVSSVEAKVVSANSAIEAAQAAVDSQSGKTYVINISSEDNLGQAVSSVVQQFKSDVQVVIGTITAARTAVKDAFGALRSLHTEAKNE